MGRNRLNIGVLAGLSAALWACADAGSTEGQSDGLTAGMTVGDGDGDGDGDSGDGDDLLDAGVFDLPSTGGNTCKVDGDIDGVGDCDAEAPPDSFEPATQWEYWPGDERYSVVTPLVANLTDDNDDGDIDLCDTPDVVALLTAKLTQPADPAHLHIIDGATGQAHTIIPFDLKTQSTPAIADLDDDGTPEIVAPVFDMDGTPSHLVALQPDGSVFWESNDTFQGSYHGSSVAIADVDADGDPEIVYADMLFDHEGNMLWDINIALMLGDVSAIADLDEDGDMEIVYGDAAFHHDGTPYYQTWLGQGYPAIADLDGDSRAEVLLTNRDGISLLEHDGSITYSNLTPTGVPAEGLNWSRPATIHNFDGEPGPEFAMSSRDYYTVYKPDGSIVWSTAVQDLSGYAAGTAFDFLGDGEAEAMYADEKSMFIFDGVGTPILTTPRASHTLHEYPVVADIDNDASAEIVVVSEERGVNPPTVPSVQVIRDIDDRWIQARRIWNQHTYHVTNVREDATIPQHETPHWLELNTFRTNAQLDASGGVCQPKPED